MSGKNIKVSILKFLKARKLTCEPQAVEDHMVRIHVRTLRLTQVPRKISGMWIVSPFKSASENAFWCQAWMILQAANIQHDLANPATKRETLRPWWCCSSHFGIALPSLARAEQQRRQKRKQAALALKRLEAAAEKQVQEQLCASKKNRHVTPHLDLQEAEKRNQKRAQTKRELRKWRKAEMPETKGQCTAAEVPSQKVPPTQNFEKALRGAACCPDLTMTATMLAASQDDNNVALLKKLPKMPERDRH